MSTTLIPAAKATVIDTAAQVRLDGGSPHGDGLAPAARLYAALVALGLDVPETCSATATVAAHVAGWRPDLKAQAAAAMNDWIATAVDAAQHGGDMPDPGPAIRTHAEARSAGAFNDALTAVGKRMVADHNAAATAHRGLMLDALCDEYTKVTQQIRDILGQLPAGVTSDGDALRADCGPLWLEAGGLANRWWQIRAARTDLARRERRSEESCVWAHPERLLKSVQRGLPDWDTGIRRVEAILALNAEPVCYTDAQVAEAEKGHHERRKAQTLRSTMGTTDLVIGE